VPALSVGGFFFFWGGWVALEQGACRVEGGWRPGRRCSAATAMREAGGQAGHGMRARRPPAADSEAVRGSPWGTPSGELAPGPAYDAVLAMNGGGDGGPVEDAGRAEGRAKDGLQLRARRVLDQASTGAEQVVSSKDKTDGAAGKRTEHALK